jgi:CHAT domain-containing protein
MHVKRVLIKSVSSFILLQVILLLIPLYVCGFNSYFGDNVIDSLFENYRSNAEFDKAVILIDHSLSLISNNTEREVNLLIMKSEIFMDQGDLATARQLLENANEIRIKIPKDHLEVDFLYALTKGDLMSQSGQKKNSHQWLSKAKNLLKTTKGNQNSDAAQLFAALGAASFEAHDSANAFRYFEMSINQAPKSTFAGKILTLTSLSFLQLLGNYFNRLDLANQAKARSDLLIDSIKLPNHPALLTYYLNMISLYLNVHYDMLHANQTLDKAAGILKRYYNSGYYKYGLLYYFKGQYVYLLQDFEKAYGYLKQSEKYLDKYPNLEVFMYQTYFLLGNIYFFYKKDYNYSIQYYNRACLTKNEWLKTALVKCYLLSSYSYLALGDTVNAITHAKKGIEILKRRSSRYKGDLLAYSYRCISGIYQEIGKTDSAYRYLLKSFETSQKDATDRNLKATIARDLGFYYKSKGEYMLALQKYQQALILCSKNFTDTSILANPVKADFASEEIMIETLNMKAYTLYLLFVNNGRDVRILDLALKCHELSVKNLEKRIIDMDNENSEFKYIDKIKVSYNNAVSYSTLLYTLTGNISYAEKAFQFAEKSKMLIILINSKDKNIKKYAGIPDSLIKRETILRNEILNLQNKLFQAEQDGFSTSFQKSLIEKLAEMQLENDQLESFYKQNYHRYYDLRYNLNVMNIHQIQEFLHEDQVLIEYQLLTSELIIFTISKVKVTLRLIPYQGSEIRQIRTFRDLVSEVPIQNDADVSYRKFIKTSHLLFSWLIKPVFDELANYKLIIVPHNELNLVPFEILINDTTAIDDSSDYKTLDYLIRHSPVSYAYSGTLLFDNNPDRKSSKKLAFFLPSYSQSNFGNLKNLPKLHALSGAKEEVDRVRKLIGGDLFIGDQATETHFKSAGPKYKVIHIASHAILDDQIPTLSSLVLNPDSCNGDDGMLHSYELYQLQLNAQLVILSGCNTGMGKLQMGEGLLSLGRSFFYTGVRSVIYTQWQVADKSSAKLITGFYNELVKGKGLEESLQSAKLNFLADADPVKSHPYYWTSYVIVGNLDPVMLNNKYSMRLIIILSMILVGTLILIYRKFIS